MRTQEEILARINEIKGKDFFGFETSDLIGFLNYENAKPFLKEGVKKSAWKIEKRTPKEIMIDYMPFAWEKANNKRGISASRNMPSSPLEKSDMVSTLLY